MNCLIEHPLCISAKNSYTSPASGHASEDDQLFIVSSDQALTDALTQALTERLSQRAIVTPAVFNELLEDALTSLGQRNKQSDLSCLLIHSGGIMVAQTGRSRVLHLALSRDEIAYDSRDQIQDYSLKSRGELLRDISPGDIIIITLADRVDGQHMLEMASKHQHGEELDQLMHQALSRNRDEAPASYIITVKEVKGGILPSLKRMKWKWVGSLLALVAIVAGAVYVTNNVNIKWPSLFSKAPTPTEAPSDSVATDTITNDTTQLVTNATVAPAETKPAARPTPKEPKAEKEEATSNTEPSASAELSKIPDAVTTNAELKVDAPQAPATSPITQEPEP